MDVVKRFIGYVQIEIHPKLPPPIRTALEIYVIILQLSLFFISYLICLCILFTIASIYITGFIWTLVLELLIISFEKQYFYYERGKFIHDMCSICLDDFVEGEQIRVLPCKHNYHKECIAPCLRRNKCPYCRQRIRYRFLS